MHHLNGVPKHLNHKGVKRDHSDNLRTGRGDAEARCSQPAVRRLVASSWGCSWGSFGSSKIPFTLLCVGRSLCGAGRVGQPSYRVFDRQFRRLQTDKGRVLHHPSDADRAGWKQSTKRNRADKLVVHDCKVAPVKRSRLYSFVICLYSLSRILFHRAETRRLPGCHVLCLPVGELALCPLFGS